MKNENHIEVNGVTYVEVEFLNELLDSKGLFYNKETGKIMGIGKPLSPTKASVKIGEKLPPSTEIGMLDEFMLNDELERENNRD